MTLSLFSCCIELCTRVFHLIHVFGGLINQLNQNVKSVDTQLELFNMSKNTVPFIKGLCSSLYHSFSMILMCNVEI
jgi:hypothetical protein